MSAVVIPQPGMPSVMDAINPPASFSARKTAASNVPVPGRIDLPVNPVTQKFSSGTIPMNAPHHGSISSLLTPPSNISGDSLSPISSAASTAQAGPATQGIPPFTPNGSWNGPSGTGLTPTMSSGAGNTPQSWGSNINFPPPKNMFSSSLGSLVCPSNSPGKSDALPPPPYAMNDLNTLPPFSGPSVTMAQTTMAHLPASQPAQHHLGYMSMNQVPLTTAAVSSLPSQQNPISPDGSYLRGAPPTPANSYYGSQASNTPLQSSFPFSSTSPPALSPPPRVSPATSHGGSNFPPPPPLPNGPHQSYVSSRHFPSFGTAPMGMMAPHGSMPAYPPFNSGAAAATQRIYEHNSHYPSPFGAPPLAHNDRPFKCDQCPQSFNRNHDLKRHKRIHLAVKPFPCGWCDKSFSRKDALKRHILVKGCGKAMAGKDGDGKAMDADDKSDSEGEGSES